MKNKYYAGFQLAALHTFRPLLLICAALAILQVGAFCFVLYGSAQPLAFTTILNKSFAPVFWRLAFVGMGIMIMMDVPGKSNSGYLVRRLGLSDSIMGLLWSANGLCCLLVVWGWQVILMVVCNLLFQLGTSPDYWSHQTFFIDCYRSGFLHGILPMGDLLGWATMISLFVGLSLALGYGMVQYWRGEQSKLWLFAWIWWGANSRNSSNIMDWTTLVAFVLVSITAFGLMMAEEEKI